MNWKKNFGAYLLLIANIVFWVVMYIAWFSIYWEDQPVNDPAFVGELKGGKTYYFLRALCLSFSGVTSVLVVIYTNWFWLVKRYLAKQQYLDYFWRLVILLLVIAFFMSFHPALDDAWLILKSREEVLWRIPRILTVMYVFFMVTLLTTPLYLSYNWFQQNAQLAELKNEKLETELSFLKSQINPHFFFNTLNNLYALTLENSKAAPAVILKLSDLMRYTIYDGRSAAVPISQEVAFIDNYLELQKIRLHKKAVINFQKEISNPDLEIPPLLFVIFLENAFKHGVETLRDNAIVDLQLIESEGVIKFYCLNNYDHEERNTSKGLGLENVKRRLKLLFKDRYKLEIVDQENTYRVYLTIDNKLNSLPQ